VKGQEKLNGLIIFLKRADAVCQKLSVLVKTTAGQSWCGFRHSVDRPITDGVNTDLDW